MGWWRRRQRNINIKLALNISSIWDIFATIFSWYDKKETQGIYGRVTAEEIDELNEEGIETTTIPWFDKIEN